MNLIKFGAFGHAKPCERLRGALEELGIDYNIQLIDITAEPELGEEWNILLPPTVILVDDDRNEIRRIVGLQSQEKFKEWLSE